MAILKKYSVFVMVLVEIKTKKMVTTQLIQLVSLQSDSHK